MREFESLSPVRAFAFPRPNAKPPTVVFIPEVVSSFLDCTDYLKLLTHHEFRYIIAGQPIYENQSDWKADIQDLEKWYQENKCDMTKEKADSIVNAR